MLRIFFCGRPISGACESSTRRCPDSGGIVFFRKSLRARLWLGGLAVALFVATLVAANGFLAQAEPFKLTRVGHDFLPFYVAGTLVREGRADAMYDLDVVREREREVAAANDFPPGTGFGPFWNPPFYALPFAPLSALPYPAALVGWLSFNLLAFAGAAALLCRIVGGDWRSWGLVPLLMIASAPFLLALTHGQNTFGSLLLLTAAVLAWRQRCAVLTGVVLGLLSYKPQLAALVGLIALVDLGWRVALGAGLSGGLLLLASVVALPGALETYLTAMPQMLRYMQVEHPYMWQRHATLRAFWRLLLQGRAAGEAGLATNVLTLASAGVLMAGLLWAAVRCRFRQTDALTRDRLIGATVVAMPLVMPFYFDYDLLLLAVPAVLYALERSCELVLNRWSLLDRWIVPTWCAMYLWLIVNPDVAERTRFNGAVPMLAGLAGLLLARALRRDAETAEWVIEPPAPPLAAAA